MLIASVRPWPSLRTDGHTAPSEDFEHRRLADTQALSHLETGEPGHVQALDPRTVPICNPVLRWARRTLTRPNGTRTERNRGVAPQLSEGYEREPASDAKIPFASELS